MRIGYPCLNHSLTCRGNHSFRLASFSETRFLDTVAANLDCLAAILDFNETHRIGFFRLTSDLVPFASHPVCNVPWQRLFAGRLAELGARIRGLDLRISMHPDQFTLLHSPRPEVVARSVAELVYHAEVLDLLGLDLSARIQIHVGGVYGDKKAAMTSFATGFALLPERVRPRLTLENDDRLYSVSDCLELAERTGVPVLFDWFHHALLPGGLAAKKAMALSAATWSGEYGRPMMDYSSQQPGGRKGSHALTLDDQDFLVFAAAAAPYDPDVMLEIKDKEKSAIRAMKLLWG